MGIANVCQAVDETGAVVASYEFDPYGNPVNNIGGAPYGYTGEWYGGYIDLLYLRARWYAPETGTFLSVDPVESEPPYQYVGGNVVNWVDPSGLFPEWLLKTAYGEHTVNVWKKQDEWWWNRMLEAEHGDVLISWDKKQIAQFVLDDPLIASRWEGECYVPITAITLEGFERDGRYWSSDSFGNAEFWRKNTGEFYYAGLHPNDPTWVQFIQNEHPGYLVYMSEQRPFFGEYYFDLQFRTSHVLQHIATVADALSFGTSLAQSVAFDEEAAVFISGSCVTVEACLPAIGVVGLYDIGASLISEPKELALGLGSLITTALSDYSGGYTTIANGKVRWGGATVQSTISLRYGVVPETNYQTYINLKQLLYDLEAGRHLGFKTIIMERE